MDYVDVTTMVNPIVNWAQIDTYEPQRRARWEFFQPTQSARTQENPFDLFMSGTGVYSPTLVIYNKADKSTQNREITNKAVSTTSPATPQQSDDVEIDQISKQRVKILAAKYAVGTASEELIARLEILNRRLLDRSPRVSLEQVEALESANEKLLRIRASREERARRLGITTSL